MIEININKTHLGLKHNRSLQNHISSLMDYSPSVIYDCGRAAISFSKIGHAHEYLTKETGLKWTTIVALGDKTWADLVLETHALRMYSMNPPEMIKGDGNVQHYTFENSYIVNISSLPHGVAFIIPVGNPEELLEKTTTVKVDDDVTVIKRKDLADPVLEFGYSYAKLTNICNTR